ncbi:MAG: Dabb family protein [Kiritimatiellae bacterium]|nr:Dabb family protein [Kiritimatiellia bacterium]MDD5521559.1 Dabb family protein [Kiritimatiellia bacterium]
MKRICGCLIVFSAVVFLAAGCRTTSSGTCDKKTGNIQHVVVFWLKDHGNINDREHLIKTAKDLAQLPGVLGVKAGTMVPSERPIVDSTYDVAMVFSFESKQALADYSVNPKHQKAVDEIIKPLVSRILVYDFVEK